MEVSVKDRPTYQMNVRGTVGRRTGGHGALLTMDMKCMGNGKMFEIRFFSKEMLLV